MNNGRVEQQGKPLELYYRPGNLFVAGFIGSPAMNFLAGTAEPGVGLDLGTAGRLAVDLPGVTAGQKITLGIRPEHLAVTTGEGPGLAVTVDLVERLGETGYAHLRLASGQVVIAEIRGETGLRPGDRASARPDPSHIHLFGPSGARLG
jgi:ABC-type sugar transport system ATPase subunit